VTQPTVTGWRWPQHLALWSLTAVVVIGIALVADRFEGDWDGAWSVAFLAMALVQLSAVLLTIKWLAAARPHGAWHWGKLALVWASLFATLLFFRSLTDGDWLPVVVYGGASSVAICVGLTWTWLSTRDRP